ncbi:MAG TPA: NUDIX hydrolase [Marmoricola sp.]
MPRSEVVAAGAVVTRRGGREVLLVHRPKYDDWSFPKGKAEPGEHVTTTAVREVEEETGLRIVLGMPLPTQAYLVASGRPKVVHYWVARARGDDDVSGYRVNSEIDDVRWVDLDEARRMLSYLDDVELLEEFGQHPKRTRALVVVRHATAVPRKKWDGPDPERPLTPTGRAQAAGIAPVLAAYRVRAVLTSPSLRCVDTISPFARGHNATVGTESGLSEEGVDPPQIAAVLDRLLATASSTAVCTHRPVLPLVLSHLGIDTDPLAPGELIVCHHRSGRIRALERHLPG